MRHRKPLRASFVVTVASTAALLGAGCSDSIGPGAGPDAMGPAECPWSAPANAMECSAALESRVCSYECGQGGSGSATCVRGRWESRIGTCNPPPPDVPVLPDVTDATVLPDTNPPPPSCPTTPPMSGSPCTVAMVAQTCSYGDCFGTPNIQARCATGAWEVATLSCNPPPDVPITPPDAAVDAPPDA